MDWFGRCKEICSLLPFHASPLARSRSPISATLGLRSMIVASCMLSLVFPTLASSHNEVTGWTRLFGPYPLDRGGDIPSYVNTIAAANGSGALVVIEGTCVSACTIRLGAKNRCVRSDAILWFHAAVEGSSISATANAVLLDAYPPRVREEVLRRGMLEDVDLNPENTLTGRELIGLGERECR